ncbi:hypothetical protein DSO57_1000489 [Entomophthora muscae]|uniref:Uncharacterized protein n=1 Tax=Entomophthora muscae TaxID=34485 RepID=A0ACC2UVX5_9FUNG|nr:hypothetical protein DSO57_1000489 [Entomophthora muscae]
MEEVRATKTGKPGFNPSDPPSSKAWEKYLLSTSSCPPSPKPQIIKLVRSLSSMQLLAETGACFPENSSKKSSLKRKGRIPSQAMVSRN